VVHDSGVFPIRKESGRASCGVSLVFRIETFDWESALRFIFYCRRGSASFGNRRLSSVSYVSITKRIDARLRRPRFRKGQAMKTATGGLLLALLSVVSLGGCIHSTGPCYGVGCHAFIGAQPSATQSNSGKKSQSGHKLLKKIKL
jgi:hypothetical protein